MEYWSHHLPPICKPLLYHQASSQLVRMSQQLDVRVHCTKAHRVTVSCINYIQYAQFINTYMDGTEA